MSVFRISGKSLFSLFAISLISCALATQSHAQGLLGDKTKLQGEDATLDQNKSLSGSANGLSDSNRALPDYTNKLFMRPGMQVTYPVHDGIDTRWKRIGDYDFSAVIEPKQHDYTYSYRWSMSPPADASGIRSVSPTDQKISHKVSLFYPDGQDCCLVGYTNILRISDDLFKRLKRQERTEFELDGPEVLQVYHHDSVPLPHWIEKTGTEWVDVMVNNKPARVRAIKTETSNHWHYWVMDNASFPIIVRADGPFRWDPPSFNTVGGDDREGKRIVNDLKAKGEATTHSILFDFDSDKLKPQSLPILNEIGKYLKSAPDIKVAVQGHCDIVGAYQYNIDLSKRRSASVIRYLSAHYGIAPARLRAEGYGWTKPIATNKTAAGRALNRRVVFKEF